jgi:hypothetical protein
MPSNRQRGGLVGLKRPLLEAAPAAGSTGESAGPPAPAAPAASAMQPPPAAPVTRPATYHLPVDLLQRLRATCRIKNTTMVEFVRQAIEEALERQRPTREEIGRLLGEYE